MWTIQFLWTTSPLAKCVHKATRWIQLLDSEIKSIGHRDGAIRGTAHAVWLLKLTLGITLLTAVTPDGEEWFVIDNGRGRGIGRGEDLHTVGFFIAHDEVVGEGLDAETSRITE